MDISADATVCPIGGREIIVRSLPIAVYKFSFGTAPLAASAESNE